MAPVTSVRSIRLPNESWEWLAKEAERRKVTVNGLVVAMVTEHMAPGYSERAQARAAKGGFKPQPTPFVEHMTVAVPLHKPKAFNPQPKKGGKK